MATTSPIPWVYRLILTTVEPLFATSGALLVFRNPAGYLATMTRDLVPYSESTGNRFLYTSLGGSWLYFAFVEAVVLRLYANDVRLWRVLSAGMMLSDIAFCHSAAQAVGGWAEWFTVSHWTRSDWVVFFTTAPMVASRVLLLLGVGFSSNKAGKIN